MTASKIFLYFCLSFIGGIFLSSFFALHLLVLGGGLILGILLISVFWQYKKFVVIGFCLLFLVVGIWRHHQVELGIMNNELRNYNDQEEIITLAGVIAKEPDIRENNVKLTIRPEKINGKILVTTNRYPEYQYGDKLKITGKLKNPSEDIGGFNYKNYLKKKGIYSVMDWPKIELVGVGFGNPVMTLLFSFKDKFKETARTFIPPPEIGILEALVFGEKGNISKEWKEKLNFTGTSHIVAVSGMNITIITFLILSFLLLSGFRRRQAFYLSVFILILYILMIGAPASAVRAGIMGGLFLLAQYLGRLSTASRTLFFAAAFMLALNPLLLRSDVGFQLSFLAMMGLIYLQSIFFDWFKPIPDYKFFPLKTTLSATVSAQVFTAPILIYNFGHISLVSLITNILIVPFLVPITILIFIFGFFGMISWIFGWILSWPTFFAVTYIVKIIDLFSGFPFASLKLENIHWLWLIISYSILGFLTWRLQKSQELKFLNY